VAATRAGLSQIEHKRMTPAIGWKLRKHPFSKRSPQACLISVIVVVMISVVLAGRFGQALSDYLRSRTLHPATCDEPDYHHDHDDHQNNVD